MTTAPAYAPGSVERRDALAGEAALVLADAERLTANPADLRTVHSAYARLELALAS